MRWIWEELKFTFLVVTFNLMTSRISGVRFSPKVSVRLRARRRMLYVLAFCIGAEILLICGVLSYAGLSWKAYAGLAGVLAMPLSLGAYVCLIDYRRERNEELARSVLET